MMETHAEIRHAMRALCAHYPNTYWRELEATNAYPDDFVNAMVESGFLGCLIPETYGGSGLGLQEAGVILEELSRSGGHPGACHAQMYTMGTLLRHGNEQQKQTYLPKIAAGQLRLQAFAVTEPDAGTDTTAITTFARRDANNYVVNGRKVFISRAEHSDLMLLLARTTPKQECQKKSQGMSVFLVDMRKVRGQEMQLQPIDMMMNHHCTEVSFNDMRIPADSLIGEEGKGFKYILDSLNAERILIAYECIGDSKFFIDRAKSYAAERVVFGRAIGQNQGVQFPIARAYTSMRAAELMVVTAAQKFDAGKACGEDANIAKLLASEASWAAGDTCLQTHGGFGFAKEFDIERKLRETRLYQVAPISTNLILSYVSEHVLGLPRSF
ncbi:MAG: acyl-CoA/acyl-ACP dehydrogenase [Gammaproteobacteria bacterium]|nr:acyl-CoA/acyl-ACP dehydrogenase [Gammaproteobacteria bacterium]MCP4881505.1 acyl-CoA/acyl-ACP dehydrogenase [Gammaproteobacteria bacterium]